MHSKGIHFTTFNSPVGSIGLAFTSRGLYRVLLDLSPQQDIPRLLGQELDGEMSRDDAMGGDLIEGLHRYFTGERWEYKGELDLSRGTPFQQRVWQELRRIPYGEVKNYRWVAERVGCPRGQRAVGQANSRNPIPLIIPCHRVIRSDGDLGGYSGGLGLKKKLLALEGVRNDGASAP